MRGTITASGTSSDPSPMSALAAKFARARKQFFASLSGSRAARTHDNDGKSWVDSRGVRYQRQPDNSVRRVR